MMSLLQLTLKFVLRHITDKSLLHVPNSPGFILASPYMSTIVIVLSLPFLSESCSAVPAESIAAYS